MSVIQEYHNHINAILSEVFDQEATAMEEAAAVLADANKAGRSIFGFGCNHAGLITLELFYRTGGMVMKPDEVLAKIKEISGGLK